jgi:hypothetical protein
MNLSQEQQLLLDIAETWNLSEIPEYRGFRCANCQEYKNKAWYHWLNSGGYKLPIHLCDEKCEKEFQKNAVRIDFTRKKIVNRNSFGSKYIFNSQSVERFEEIVSLWPDYRKPELKVFFCDECKKDLYMDYLDNQRKGFHVWWKTKNDILIELHFHKECGKKLGII